MVKFFYHLDYCGDDVSLAPATHALADPFHQTPSPKKRRRQAAKSPLTPVLEAGTAAPSTPTDGNMVMHARVFAAAVKYQVPALKALSASKFAHAVEANASHDTFAEAVHITYTTTPEEVTELRDVIAKTLTERGELLNKPEVEVVVRSINGLAYELLKRSRATKATPAMKNGEYGPCSGCGLDRSPSSCGCGQPYLVCSCYTRCRCCGRQISGRTV